MSRPTSRASALLAAARADGPDAATRDALWEKIAGDTVGVAAASHVAASPVTSAPLTLVKSVAFAVVAAAAVGASMLVVPDVTEAPAAVVQADGAARALPRTFEPALHRTTLRDVPRAKVESPVLPAKPVETVRTPSAAPESGFAEEARLVADARSALVAGDPARALALVTRAEASPSKGLVPEELGIRARALHALGRTDEAAEVELNLKRSYPDHALAR